MPPLTTLWPTFPLWRQSWAVWKGRSQSQFLSSPRKPFQGHKQISPGWGGDWCGGAIKDRIELSCAVCSWFHGWGSSRAMPVMSISVEICLGDFPEPDAWLAHGLRFCLNKLRFSWHLPGRKKPEDREWDQKKCSDEGEALGICWEIVWPLELSWALLPKSPIWFWLGAGFHLDLVKHG